MQVYEPVVAEGFEWVQPVDESDFDRVYQLDGTPLSAGWKPIRVRRLQADEKGNAWRPADMPWLGGHALVFRDDARRAIQDVLADFGEFLELDLVDDSGQAWLFNVCTVVDALDEEASKIVRFPSTGRVMKVVQPVFRPQRIVGKHAFRLPDLRSLFVTAEVVGAIRDAGLAGAGFKLVWEDSVDATP